MKRERKGERERDRERERERERRERERERDREKKRVSNTNYTIDLVYYLGKRGGEKGIRNKILKYFLTVQIVFSLIFYYWKGEFGWLEGESSFQNLFEYINYAKLLYCIFT